MTPDLLDLQLPVFDSSAFPRPAMTLDEWIEWLDWCRSELISATDLERQILARSARPVSQPFILD